MKISKIIKNQNKKLRIMSLCLIMTVFVTISKLINSIIINNIYNYISLVIDIIFIGIIIVLEIKYIKNKLIIDENKMEIENLKFYNKNLNELYDNIRAFRHDFSNIIQAMGGYIYNEDIDSLKKMYNDLYEDCEENKKLEVLNPNIINDAAIYNIINEKYNKAKELKIKMSIDIYIDFETMQIKTYELARILGILLDNAIEASKNQKEKIIRLKFKKEIMKKRDVVIIENTYDQSKIDIDKIFEKGYSTKTDNENKHGLGLWEVRKILNKNDNLNLYTMVQDKFFVQQLEIYNYSNAKENFICKV